MRAQALMILGRQQQRQAHVGTLNVVKLVHQTACDSRECASRRHGRRRRSLRLRAHRPCRNRLFDPPVGHAPCRVSVEGEAGSESVCGASVRVRGVNTSAPHSRAAIARLARHYAQLSVDVRLDRIAHARKVRLHIIDIQIRKFSRHSHQT